MRGCFRKFDKAEYAETPLTRRYAIAEASLQRSLLRTAAEGGLPRCTRAQIQTALTFDLAACICGLVHRGCRRASHADKRKALQREVLRAEIHEALAGRPTRQRIHELGQRLLDLAA